MTGGGEEASQAARDRRLVVDQQNAHLRARCLGCFCRCCLLLMLHGRLATGLFSPAPPPPRRRENCIPVRAYFAKNVPPVGIDDDETGLSADGDAGFLADPLCGPLFRSLTTSNY